MTGFRFFLLRCVLGSAALGLAPSLLLGQSAPSATDLPPAPDQIVTRDAIVSFVTATLMAWESSDREVFLAAFAEDALFAYPGGRVDKVGLAALYADLHARKSDVKVYIGPFVVMGNDFALRYQFACTDRITGKRQAVGTGVRGRLRDGRIVLLKEYWDAHIAVDQTVGDLPLDEGNPLYPSPSSHVMGPERIN